MSQVITLPALSQPIAIAEGVIHGAGTNFIEANTQLLDISDLREHHLIPVFIKDNQPTISQIDFIDTTWDVAQSIFGPSFSPPVIRVSHPIKNRIPDARHKAADDLEEWEKTIYYERMAFIAEFPSITWRVNGKELTLTVGGIKAYNLDNLKHYSTSGTQHFKVFIGFKVTVCTNLCVWTDGFSCNWQVRSLKELSIRIRDLFETFQADKQSQLMTLMDDYHLNERQFAQILGRARMYHALPPRMRREIPELLIPDSHVSTIAQEYYEDKHFCRLNDGSISLWNFYNLLTSAAKRSYIDAFLERNVNAGQFTMHLAEALSGGPQSWYLS